MAAFPGTRAGVTWPVVCLSALPEAGTRGFRAGLPEGLGGVEQRLGREDPLQFRGPWQGDERWRETQCEQIRPDLLSFAFAPIGKQKASSPLRH